MGLYWLFFNLLLPILKVVFSTVLNFRQLFKVIDEKAKKHIQTMSVPQTGQTAVQKAAGLVKACVAFTKRRRSETQHIRRFTASLNLDLFDLKDDPGEDPLDRMLHLSLEYSVHILVSASVTRHTALAGKHLLQVITPLRLRPVCFYGNVEDELTKRPCGISNILNGRNKNFRL